MTVKFVGPSSEAVIEEDGNYNYNGQIRRDLISADALIVALYEARRSEYETTPKLVRFIDRQPRIEPKRGRWIVKGQDIYCSICDNESAYNPFGASKFSLYCPHCGARMDKERK